MAFIGKIIYGMQLGPVIVNAQTTYGWLGDRSESIVDPECTIDLTRVVYKYNPRLDLALNKTE